MGSGDDAAHGPGRSIAVVGFAFQHQAMNQAYRLLLTSPDLSLLLANLALGCHGQASSFKIMLVGNNCPTALPQMMSMIQEIGQA